MTMDDRLKFYKNQVFGTRSGISGTFGTMDDRLKFGENKVVWIRSGISETFWTMDDRLKFCETTHSTHTLYSDRPTDRPKS